MCENYNSYQQFLMQNINDVLEKQQNVLSILDIQKVSDQLLKEVFYNYQLLDSKTELLQNEIKYQLNNYKNELQNIDVKYKSLSPEAPLERGYALLTHNSVPISQNESLSNFKKFEIIRKNEKIIAKFETLINDTLF